MNRRLTSLTAIVCALVFPLTFLASPAAAEDHIVPSSQLHQTLVNAATARQKNIAEIDHFFSSKPAEKALRRGGFDLNEIEQAAPSLSDQELARLASQTSKVQNDFAAGALSNEYLTYIVIAIAAALLVVLVFEA
ncbi:MAG: PA2779 family protein [Terriglobia bacterium]